MATAASWCAQRWLLLLCCPLLLLLLLLPVRVLADGVNTGHTHAPVSVL